MERKEKKTYVKRNIDVSEKLSQDSKNKTEDIGRYQREYHRQYREDTREERRKYNREYMRRYYKRKKVIDSIMEKEGLEYQDALEKANNIVGWDKK